MLEKKHLDFFGLSCPELPTLVYCKSTAGKGDERREKGSMFLYVILPISCIKGKMNLTLPAKCFSYM